MNRNLPIETQRAYKYYGSDNSDSSISDISNTLSYRASSMPVSALPKVSSSLSNSNNSSKPDPMATDSYFDDISSAQKYNLNTTMFTALKDLFWHITTRVSRSGTYNPNKFITTLKQSNPLFRNNFHQDAHEMFNYLINEIAENVENIQISKELTTGTGRPLSGPNLFSKNTWVHTLFEGLLTNETKCLTCENTTNRDETFFDLSVDISNNCSVTSCMRQFASGEIMNQNNKFLCENCGTLQEAERRMRVKRLPNVLALHLKRFKYKESIGNYVKLNYRVNYPLTLRVPDTTQQTEDVEYNLVGTIVHLGSGLNQGHYIVIVKSGDKWVVYDDDYVDIIDESDLELYYGDSLTFGGTYVLLYERADFDPLKYDLPGNSLISPVPIIERNSSTPIGAPTPTPLPPTLSPIDAQRSSSVPPPPGAALSPKTSISSTKPSLSPQTTSTPGSTVNEENEDSSEDLTNQKKSESPKKEVASSPSSKKQDSVEKEFEINEFSSSSILSNLVKNKGASSFEDAMDAFLKQSTIEISVREPTTPQAPTTIQGDKGGHIPSSNKSKWNIFAKNKVPKASRAVA
ncbi:Ubiquitin carboxyl-terminal hydrolase 4 [Smittium mucronatum]|uniref:ubiquitinyl hydrolase 1 n=1 Tax=Smittium mucronatum TaxID=133383 RepID=A0A1R0H340_9FUNG|nr:Ubiquitin carboxyl-terminal hydrolase 4 [Smittium mucronatum]